MPAQDRVDAKWGWRQRCKAGRATIACGSQGMQSADEDDLNAALAACRARLALDVRNWQAALEFKAAMAAASRYAESDPVFRAARAVFPDDVWLAHMAALHAYPQAELDAMTSRAAILAAQEPEDGVRARLLGNLLLQARDYPKAASATQRAPDPAYAQPRPSAARSGCPKRRRISPAAGCRVSG